MNPSLISADPRARYAGSTTSAFRVFIETVRDYALLHARSHRAHRELESGRRGHQGLQGRGNHRPALLGVLSTRGRRARAAGARAGGGGAARAASKTKAGACARTARASGRTWSSPRCTRRMAHSSGYAKVTRDLTERRRHEEALRYNEVRFRTLVEGVRDYAIFMLDPDGDVATWNAGAQQIHGYRSQRGSSARTSRASGAATARERERARRELQRRRARRPLPGRRLARAQGRHARSGRTWCITAIRDQRGHAARAFPRSRATSASACATKRALRESEERFRLLVESVVDYAIVTLDEDGMITSWNSGAERINGYSAARDRRPAFLAALSTRGRRAPTSPGGSSRWRASAAASMTSPGACARTARSTGPTTSSRRCPRPRRAGARFYMVTQDLDAAPACRDAGRHRAAHARIHRHAGARIAQSAGADPQCRGAHGAPQGRRIRWSRPCARPSIARATT